LKFVCIGSLQDRGAFALFRCEISRFFRNFKFQRNDNTNILPCQGPGGLETLDTSAFSCYFAY